MNKLFSCVLSHTLCYVSIHKCWTCFYSFCLLETVLLTNRGKSPGHFCFSPLVPGGLVARTFGFYPGSPGLIPGQGIRISPSEISIIPAPMQSETLIFLYCFPVWLSPRPFPGLGQSRKEAGSTRKGGCLWHTKVKKFPPHHFPNWANLAQWKAGNIHVWTVVQTGPCSLSSLLPHQSGLLENVLYINLGDAPWGRTDSLPTSRCLQCFPSIQTALFPIHWPLRQTSCSDGVAGSR